MSAEADSGTAAPPLIDGGHSFSSLTDLVCGLVEGPTPRWWWIAMAICGSLCALGGVMTVYVISTGLTRNSMWTPSRSVSPSSSSSTTSSLRVRR